MKNDQNIKLDLHSLVPAPTKIEKLRAIIPEAFSEGKIDFDRLKQALGEPAEAVRERYATTWAGKNNCFKNIQEPSVGTLKPSQKESVNYDESGNIFIEGDNLEVLKLLQKSYYCKVKMIYIDPPYNTGGEFIYPDNFTENLDTYLKYTGQKSAEGTFFSTNVETDGRFHSKWMNMMYTRLYLARNLLRDDGVIFIVIDDHELINLRKICDEIFDEDNFVSHIVWQHSLQPKGYTDIFSVHHNHILCYRKTDHFEISPLERTDQDNINYSNPDNDPNGLWRTGDVRNALYRPNLIYPLKTPSGKTIQPPDNGWRWSKETMAQKISTGEITFSADESRIIRKIYLNNQDGRAPETIWFGKDVGTTRDGSTELKDLFDDKAPFDTVKPINLMKRSFQIAGMKSGDICLDFFAGSGSTAVALLDYKPEARFITVQLPEKINTDTPHGKVASELGLKNVAEISKERIRRFIKSDKKFKNLGFKVFKLAPSNFKVWDTTHQQDIAENLKLFADNIDQTATPQDILFEILLKSGFDLATKIEKITLANQDIYSIEEGTMLVFLGTDVSKELTYEVAEKVPARFVCLDQAFHHNDQLKTNTVQLMKTRNIEFRTV